MPQMLRDITQWIVSCSTCQARKWPYKAVEVFPAERPYHRLAIDVLGPFIKSDKGNKFILCTVCHFSKYAICRSEPDCQARTIAKTLISEVFCVVGMPEQILSDRAQYFIGDVMASLYKLLKIGQLRTSAFHPQTRFLGGRISALT